MEEEKQNKFVVIGLILLLLMVAIFEVLQLGNETTKPIQRNPVSQTRATDEFHSFNFTFENEGTEIRGMINNKTEVQVWSKNETELTYRGTIENYSGVQLSLWINKSMVDTVKVVQP